MIVQIKTTRFGEVEIAEDKLMTFSKGILGFSRHRQYFVLDHGENSPFKWLQCAEDPNLAFVITDPAIFKPDYQVTASREDVACLDLSAHPDVVISVIVTVPENSADLTANLRAPLLFNMENRKAMQLVIMDNTVPVKHRILDAAAQASGAIPVPDSQRLVIRAG